MVVFGSWIFSELVITCFPEFFLEVMLICYIFNWAWKISRTTFHMIFFVTWYFHSEMMRPISYFSTRNAQIKWFLFLFLGYCFYQSSKCGICVSLGQRYDRRKHYKRTGTSSYCSYLPISKLQVNNFGCYMSTLKMRKV